MKAKLLHTEEVAKVLGVSRRTVRQPAPEKREAGRRRKATTKLLVMDGLLDENGRIARRR